MIDKERIKLLPIWCLTETHPAFYDTESKSAVGQTAKLYGAMRELQEDYNTYVNEINETITAFINDVNADQEEFINSINKIVHDYIAMIDEKIKLQDKEIDDAVQYMKDNIATSIHDLVYELNENHELDNMIISAMSNIEDELKSKQETFENSRS